MMTSWNDAETRRRLEEARATTNDELMAAIRLLVVDEINDRGHSASMSKWFVIVAVDGAEYRFSMADTDGSMVSIWTNRHISARPNDPTWEPSGTWVTFSTELDMADPQFAKSAVDFILRQIEQVKYEKNALAETDAD